MFIIFVKIEIKERNKLQLMVVLCTLVGTEQCVPTTFYFCFHSCDLVYL